ncbi:hypothetical protein JCM10295v2_002944 [Rhodotorula toruloides]
MVDEYVWLFPPIQNLHVVKHDPISCKTRFLEKLSALTADEYTQRGVEVVWCKAEEYDFILPEFEAYIRRPAA